MPKTNRKADTTPKTTMIEIERYDWLRWPQSVCLRLQPSLRPRSFRYVIRVSAVPTEIHALRANEAMTSHLFGGR